MAKRAAIILSLAAIAAAAPAWAASVEHGRALAATSCAACHSIDRSGASPNPKAPPFRTLGHSYPIEDIEESLAEGIVTGHRQMPQFQFSAGDVEDLVAFLKSLQPGRPAEPTR
jgi:mono/diheme cytochrome c family protein